MRWIAGLLLTLAASPAAHSSAIAERWRPWRAYAVLHLWRRMSVSVT